MEITNIFCRTNLRWIDRNNSRLQNNFFLHRVLYFYVSFSENFCSFIASGRKTQITFGFFLTSARERDDEEKKTRKQFPCARNFLTFISFSLRASDGMQKMNRNSVYKRHHSLECFQLAYGYQPEQLMIRSEGKLLVKTSEKQKVFLCKEIPLLRTRNKFSA